MAKRMVLPPLPDAVATQLGPVPVRAVKKLRYKRDGKKQKLFGRYHSIARVIEINADAAPVMQWQTLRHEWVHVILSDAGLHNAFSEEQQEVIADVIATALTTEMLAISPFACAQPRSDRRGVGKTCVKRSRRGRAR